VQGLRSVLAAGVLLGATLLAGAPAGALDSPAGQLASEVPAAGTPQVLDGQVDSVIKVGNTMILGGSFTEARNDSDNNILSRRSLLAFDATTGRISTSFVPAPNGPVEVLLPTGDGSSIYVGGNFTSIGGVARKNLARVRVSDGAVLTGFNAGSVTGKVNDLKLSDGRLWVTGAFTHIAGRAQPALATVNPTTGAFDPFMTRTLSGIHNGGTTGGLKIDITPDGRTLAVIGNFDLLDGVKDHQLALLDLSGPSAQRADFQTAFYEQPCSLNFFTYMRDVDFSPDGSYFVIVTTGAYGGPGGACDSSARFETGSTGSGIVPSWVDNTGGDTLTAVEVTDDVVYVGGHPRWQNNPFRSNVAGQGAVSRQGLAALNPINGLPLTWDPTRTRGVGVFDFLVTPAGLWITSDTDRIGDFYLRGRIALMPFTGERFPAYKTPGLPNDIYSLSAAGVSRRSFADGVFTQPTTVGGGGINWDAVRGSFMLNGQLYLAWSNGTFDRRPFNGTTFGSPVPVDTSDEIVRLDNWHADVANLTNLFYDSGRMYYTVAGTRSLFYRYLSPQSDVVGAQRLTASGSVAGIDFGTARGLFKGGSRLYFTIGDGALRSVAWQDRPTAGVPVANTQNIVSSPRTDGNTWVSPRGQFLFQDANGDPAGHQANQAPQASFTVSCAELTCSFDASASTDDDGSISSYAWSFGDGGTGSGRQVTHSFDESGSYPVTLTVTDNAGSSSTLTRTAVAERTDVPAASLGFVGATSTNGNRVSHTVGIPASVRAGDVLLTYLTTNDSATAVTPPSGWTDVTESIASGTAVRVWSRTATSGDAGQSVTATTSAFLKSDMSVVAYRSTTGSAHVGASASVLSTELTASHTTPAVNAVSGGSWLVSYWAKESSTVPSWTHPAGQALRTSSVGTGGGNISAILTDGNGPVPVGTVGGLTATTSEAVSRTAMASVVLSPG
jgi:PKD repeat protein